VKIYSYNDHVRLLSPEPVGWIQHHQLYSGGGADIVMQSIVSKPQSMSEIGVTRVWAKRGQFPIDEGSVSAFAHRKSSFSNRGRVAISTCKRTNAYIRKATERELATLRLPV
jgi:hypothetical protein